jgi:hypothetical protein
MSNEEIIAFFSIKKSGTCGRFHSGQLAPDSPKHSGKALRYTFLPAGALSLLLFLTAANATAFSVPEKMSSSLPVIEMTESVDATVKGYVRDESGEPLAGTTVYVKGTQKGTITDEKGYFELAEPVEEGAILVFSFIGYETQEYVVKEGDSENIDIQLVMFVDIMGEVEIGEIYCSEKESPGIWRKIKSIFK